MTGTDAFGHRPAVVLCPPLAPDRQPPRWHAPLATALRDAGILVIDPGPSTTAPLPMASANEDRLALAVWVSDQAVAITRASPDRRLVLVAFGAALRGLPALGLSQRAARRAVVGYVLVDGQPPAPGGSAPDWPGAPALYLRTPPAQPLGWSVAQLRGWHCLHADPVRAIPAYVDVWPDRPPLS